MASNFKIVKQTGKRTYVRLIDEYFVVVDQGDRRLIYAVNDILIAYMPVVAWLSRKTVAEITKSATAFRSVLSKY